MKALVAGGGSMGRRHLRNLKELGVGSLALAEPDGARREAGIAETGAFGFANIEEGLAWRPDLAVIATPSFLHASQALMAIRAGVDVFVEKPLAHSAAGLEELAAEVRARNLITLVGCNMRFHPGLAAVRDLLEHQAVGKVLFGRLQSGSYLPGWHPGFDYRASYSARGAMGGGCILDCIHEIDLARWLLGDVTEVSCMAGHLSSLEVDVEDVALLACRHASGALSEIHLDYVQRTYERDCQIAGENGSIFWNFGAQTVRSFDASARRWSVRKQPDNWEINQMYLDEMRHFLDCVRERKPSALPVPEALRVMRIALAAKDSATSGRTVLTENAW